MIKVLEFLISDHQGPKNYPFLWHENDKRNEEYKISGPEEIEKSINEEIEKAKSQKLSLKDIKILTVNYHHHNNGGCESIIEKYILIFE